MTIRKRTSGCRLLILLAVTFSPLLCAGTATAHPIRAWQFSAQAPIVSSPVSLNGVVYFGSLDSTFYALDLQTGALQWKLKTGGEIRSTPLVLGDRVYFTSGDGLLRALLASSGHVEWTFATEGEKKHDFADYFQSSPVASKGILYFGSGDAHVYAVTAKDGALVWKFKTGDVVHATPAVDSDRVFVGSFDGYFYALMAGTGELVWKFKSVGQSSFPTGEFQGSPTLYRGLVLVGARDFNFYALDREKGYCHWNKRFPRGWALPNVIHDTVLYIGSSDDRLLMAVNPLTGMEYWKTNLHFNIFGGFTPIGTAGCVGTLQGKLYGVNLRRGDVTWTFATAGYERNHLKYFKPDDSFRDDIFEHVKSDEAFIQVENEVGAIFSTPLAVSDYLVVTSTDGTVYAFKL